MQILVLLLICGTVIPARVPICRPDCDLSDITDEYCRSDREACVAKTVGEKLFAGTAIIGCVGTVGMAGCPSVGSGAVYGKGPVELLIEAIKKSK